MKSSVKENKSAANEWLVKQETVTLRHICHWIFANGNIRTEATVKVVMPLNQQKAALH